MKKQFILIISAFVLLSAGIISFISCKDNENEVVENTNATNHLKSSTDLMEKFYSGQIINLDKDSLINFMKEVSTTYDIDMFKLSENAGVAELNQIEIDQCFMKGIEEGRISQSTIIRMNQLLTELDDAKNNQDSNKVMDLYLEAYNICNCANVLSWKDIIEDEVHNHMVAMKNLAVEGIREVKKEFPKFESFDEEEQIFLLTLAMSYKDYIPFDSSKAPYNCKRNCDNSYNSNCNYAYARYAATMGGCLIFVPTGWGYAGCVATASVILYIDMHQNANNKKTCYAGC